MTPSMSKEQAWEQLIETVDYTKGLLPKYHQEKVKRCLEVLSGLTPYWSRFKVGDGVYWIERPGTVWGTKPTNYGYFIGVDDHGPLIDMDEDRPRSVPDDHLFARYDEALEDCQRRNSEQERKEP
jgi:hypothetical protein